MEARQAQVKHTNRKDQDNLAILPKDWEKLTSGIPEVMRTFKSGAIRDSDQDKPDYSGYLSPRVLKAFGMYMLKHQTLPDGSKRGS
ncbi:MAG: hypothetical protein KGJ90_03955, partial [Patescibacteria group bacterium]|nr:hypothetical protein [Patescibacteria group bacterium]